MVASLHVSLAAIAGVDKVVFALVVKFVQQRHRRQLGSPQRRKLVMLFTGDGEEGITSIHQVTAHGRVGIRDGGQTDSSWLTMQTDHKENLHRHRQMWSVYAEEYAHKQHLLGTYMLHFSHDQTE